LVERKTQCGGGVLDRTTDHPSTTASRPHSTATLRINDARADEGAGEPVHAALVSWMLQDF